MKLINPMPDLDQLTAKALQAAYSGNWKQAIVFNQQILDKQSNSLEALNRLAKAYMELDQPKKAVFSYKKVLKIDPYNRIAQKNLSRLKNYSQGGLSTHAQNKTAVVTFIEEPGKTKTVPLVNIGEPGVLAKVDAGDQVRLKPKKRFVCVSTLENNLHLGKIPEDLSLRLITLINGGNQYQAWVKSIKDHHVSVFIKEVYRTSKFSSISSFPDSDQSSYLAFTHPAAAYSDRPDTTSTEEQE